MKTIVTSEDGNIYAIDHLGKLYVAVWSGDEPFAWRHIPMQILPTQEVRNEEG